MGYDSSRLNLVSQGIAQARQWDYEDTGGETVAVFTGASWFSDAKDKGVDTGDFINIRDRTNTIQYEAYFAIIYDTGTTKGGTVVLDTG
jgi:hypothetical protein